MIAFCKDVEETSTTEEVRRARKIVAKTLFTAKMGTSSSAPPVAGWKSWLFATWVAIVTVYYFGCMIVSL